MNEMKKTYLVTAEASSDDLRVTVEETSPQPEPEGPKERFGFSYPNFGPSMPAEEFVKHFAAAMHNPDSYKIGIQYGTDIRVLNPNGVYLKHINLRTIIPGYDDDHPSYDWVHKNHPEWIVKDANGNPVPMFLPGEECVDFGNDAYLDYALNDWMPNMYLDETDKDPGKTTYYLQDNGNFTAMSINCAGGDNVCSRYTTDEGVQSAWKHMLDRWKQRWPNKKIFVNTGPNCYQPPDQQLPPMKDVLAHADGYYSESLTTDHVYYSGQPKDQLRNAMEATMQLADWLAENNKFFFPNLGTGEDGSEPTQKEVDYAYAFFNLMRRGDKQFFSRACLDAGGLWVPEVYPEMTLSLGSALEERTEISTNLYRRRFAAATAYVNLRNDQVSISLPETINKNSLGANVASPLLLGSFSGLTLYH
jgi:Hypothetical glycosyl hydrolase family 15